MRTHSKSELWLLKAVHLSQVLGTYHGVPKLWVDIALSGVSGSHASKMYYGGDGDKLNTSPPSLSTSIWADPGIF